MRVREARSLQLLVVLAELSYLIDLHLLLPSSSNLYHALEPLTVHALPIDLLHLATLTLREITGALGKHELVFHLLVLELGVKVTSLSVKLAILVRIV